MTAAEVRAMLRERNDSSGECDGCHRETELWTGDDPGEFQLCRRCWGLEANRAARQERTIVAQVTA